MGPGMGMQMRPEMRQQMILAPRMIQSMEILQLPIMALQERIQQELQENPVLEMQEKAEEEAEAEADGQPAKEEPAVDVTDPTQELVIDEKDTDIDFERLEA